MLYLFDIDGTLVTCSGAGRRAFERACAGLLGQEALRAMRLDGMTDPLILAEAFQRCLRRLPTAREAAAIERSYARLLAEETAREGVVRKLPYVDDVLTHLAARGAALGLATGNWRVGARIKLSRVALWERFLFGGFGCDAGDRGELVRIAWRRGEAHLGRSLRREEVFVVGDTPRDVAAAHAAGAVAVAVSTGAYDRAELHRAGADAVYADLGAFMATIA